ncbi:MAG: hypothetical protein IPL88_13365 [Rhizobiales bacterium]|nr:hypothetical protein [Hyphomicrobiales bacterium]
MRLFRAWLATILIVLIVYTAAVAMRRGVNLFPVFFGDIAALDWPGQFNLDFTFMLTLSALWTAWRGGFSAASLGLAALALIGGSLFLSIYLLIESARCGGDPVALLIGRERAARRA